MRMPEKSKKVFGEITKYFSDGRYFTAYSLSAKAGYKIDGRAFSWLSKNGFIINHGKVMSDTTYKIESGWRELVDALDDQAEISDQIFEKIIEITERAFQRPFFFVLLIRRYK